MKIQDQFQQTWNIKFTKFDDEKRKSDGWECLIFRIWETENSGEELYFSGISQRNRKDSPNDIHGKAIALSRALNVMSTRIDRKTFDHLVCEIFKKYKKIYKFIVNCEDDNIKSLKVTWEIIEKNKPKIGNGGNYNNVAEIFGKGDSNIYFTNEDGYETIRNKKNKK